jgi:ferredoxin
MAVARWAGDVCSQVRFLSCAVGQVAPFVEMEWGTKAYQLMWEVKRLFDPQFLLNPGVILNEDPDVHSKNIRLDFAANPIVDRCISCGWCESNCPSRDLSLTPRQRIQVYKELSRMREEFAASGDVTKPDRLVAFEKSWEYAENTCAADGMCQEKCPVKVKLDPAEGRGDSTSSSCWASLRPRLSDSLPPPHHLWCCRPRLRFTSIRPSFPAVRRSTPASSSRASGMTPSRA